MKAKPTSYWINQPDLTIRDLPRCECGSWFADSAALMVHQRSGCPAHNAKQAAGSV